MRSIVTTHSIGLGLSIVAVALLLGVSRAGAEIHSAVPAAADPTKHYVIYLHGSILTGTSGEAVSQQFGTYEYAAILKRFDSAGLEVISRVRQDDDVPRQCQLLLEWIAALKASGVPSRQISVVGASMGGIIAGRASHALPDPEITYVLIACLYDMSAYAPLALNGRVLAIRDRADARAWVEPRYFENSPGLQEARMIVTDTGLGHGLLYTPLDAWVLPTLTWIHATGE